MKRAFITGIAGFAGSHLAEELLENGWEVTGCDRPGAPLDNLRAVADRIKVEECDIRREEEINALVRERRPDVVFNLAGVAFIPSAQDSPEIAFEINARGSLNVLDSCREHAPECRLIMISSAEVYGKATAEQMPLTEESLIQPANIYALSKRCAEEMAFLYYRIFGLPAIVLRPFNHIGPRQSPSFVTSDFARQIAGIEAGKREAVLRVGNLETARDFTDIRDMVRAYRLAAEKCEAGQVYNVCSGRSFTIRELLDKLLAMADRKIEVRQEEARLRKADIPLVVGDSSRFRKLTGWEPRETIDSTLRSILDYWRSEVQS